MEPAIGAGGDRRAALELLRLQVEWGADEALEPLPVDRTRALAEPAPPSPPPPPRPRRLEPSAPSPVALAGARPAAVQRAEEVAAAARTIDALREALVRFDGCALAATATNLVFADGNAASGLMFVGEAPGADEDIQARPFVGRAGQLLTKIIEAIGLKREEVLIGNVNRCRPPGNRAPTTEEASMCKPFLLREIAVVQPEVIVVLGNTAMKNLLDTREGITRLRGQFQDYKGIKVMPTFHPAYLLRQPAAKRQAWNDILLLIKRINQTNALKIKE